MADASPTYSPTSPVYEATSPAYSPTIPGIENRFAVVTFGGQWTARFRLQDLMQYGVFREMFMALDLDQEDHADIKFDLSGFAWAKDMGAVQAAFTPGAHVEALGPRALVNIAQIYVSIDADYSAWKGFHAGLVRALRGRHGAGAFAHDAQAAELLCSLARDVMSASTLKVDVHALGLLLVMVVMRDAPLGLLDQSARKVFQDYVTIEDNGCVDDIAIETSARMLMSVILDNSDKVADFICALRELDMPSLVAESVRVLLESFDMPHQCIARFCEALLPPPTPLSLVDADLRAKVIRAILSAAERQRSVEMRSLVVRWFSPDQTDLLQEVISAAVDARDNKCLTAMSGNKLNLPDYAEGMATYLRRKLDSGPDAFRAVFVADWPEGSTMLAPAAKSILAEDIISALRDKKDAAAAASIFEIAPSVCDLHSDFNDLLKQIKSKIRVRGVEHVAQFVNLVLKQSNDKLFRGATGYNELVKTVTGLQDAELTMRVAMTWWSAPTAPKKRRIS